jgi:hypothetical protein
MGGGGCCARPTEIPFLCELSGCEGGGRSRQVKSSSFLLAAARRSPWLVVWWRGVMAEAKLCFRAYVLMLV